MSTPPPNFTPLPRGEVIAGLGTFWPPAQYAPSLTVPPDLLTDPDATSGAVGVYTRPNRPGTTWWAVDGVIWPQAAGTPDETLAALLPGSVLTVPDVSTGGDTPPYTPDPPSQAEARLSRKDTP
jgi:hypothetical protein